mgnify:CR=1 FL=1
MKKDRWLLRSAVLLALSALLMTTFSLAAEAGSSGDPLVTLSYLNETFFDSVMQRVDQKIAERNGQLNQQGISTGGGASASFTVVTLSEGQTLTGGVGCEVMLRIGSAVCVSPSEPGLIDETTAATLAAIIADEAAIGMVNQKTTAVRLIPAPGKQVGDVVEFGGLLGSAPVMPCHTGSAEAFAARGGRIPAPLQSLKN